MATRIVASPKKIVAKNLRLLARPLNSVPSTISAFSAGGFDHHNNQPAAVPVPAPPPPRDVIDLSDPRKLFASVSTSKLLRSAINLHAAAVEPLVDVGTWVMRSRVVSGEGLTRDAVLGVVKRTVFEHFCGGEDTDEAARTVMTKLNQAGLRGMLDYALEDAEDNFSCDANLQAFLRTVKSATSLPPSSVSFVVAKITAICPIALLQRVSDLLRWQHMNPSHHLPWKHHSFPIFSDLTPLYHTESEPQPLSLDEERDLQLALNRLQTLCKLCEESSVPLCIDAEYSLVQPAIDYFVYSSAIEHNRQEPIIYGTLQAYLKDAKARLFLASQAAHNAGIRMGVKLVRGAYMTSESRLAHSLGFDSPVHNTIQDTHDCYNECASLMLDKIANGSGGGVVLATHNVESGEMAAKKAVELGIGKGSGKLEFAQLYGMADSFSFGLRNAGFQVSKYMPFGPVGKVMPYLLRRAEENRGLLSASTLDRKFIRKELWRRLKAGVVN